LDVLFVAEEKRGEEGCCCCEAGLLTIKMGEEAKIEVGRKQRRVDVYGKRSTGF